MNRVAQHKNIEPQRWTGFSAIKRVQWFNVAILIFTLLVALYSLVFHTIISKDTGICYWIFSLLCSARYSYKRNFTLNFFSCSDHRWERFGVKFNVHCHIFRFPSLVVT
ncbi:hypothetical protein B0H11DRAFT_2028154, partial [Mycena galericulata]